MVKATTEISSNPPGTVISTDPAAGALVKKGDTVTLKVAAVEKVAVPAGITQTTLNSAQSAPDGGRPDLDGQQRAEQPAGRDRARGQSFAGDQGPQGELGDAHGVVGSRRCAGTAPGRSVEHAGQQRAGSGRPQPRQHQPGPVARATPGW